MNSRESQPNPGVWVVPEVSYVDPQRRFCRYCGRPIARGFWRVSSGGETWSYCDARHADLDVGAQPAEHRWQEDRGC